MKINLEIDLKDVWGDQGDSVDELIKHTIHDEIHRAIKKELSAELKRNQSKINSLIKQVSADKLKELEEVIKGMK